MKRAKQTTILGVVILGVVALLALGCGADEPAGRPERAAETGGPRDEEHRDEEHRNEEHSDEEHSDEGHEPGHEDEHGHDEHGGSDGPMELGPEAIERIGLATERAALRPLAGRRTTTGTIGFDEERFARVASRVEGRLVRVPAALGADLSAGGLLAVVDSTEVGEAKAAYLRARAREEVAARRYERELSLRDDRISSEQEVLEAEAQAREVAADLASRRATLTLLGLSEEAIEGLSWDERELALVSVRAPFAGRVVARDATIGELVTPRDTLFELADLSQVWVWIDLYERDLAHVRLGDEVELRVDALPGETFAGSLAYVADRVDPASRTVRARLDLPNPRRLLKPGMFARIDLATGEEPSLTLTVPRQAIQRDGQRALVFVQMDAGRFEPREVEVGRTGGELAEILAGLAEGEDVVTEGAFLLRSQMAADEIGGHHH